MAQIFWLCCFYKHFGFKKIKSQWFYILKLTLYLTSITNKVLLVWQRLQLFNNIFSVLDSWGKIPEGILTGNVVSLGSYASCIEVDVPPHKHNGTEIKGFQWECFVKLLF